MGDYSWREAAMLVLEKEGAPMHYADIAQAIAEMGLRSEFGATPATAVNVAISTSLKADGEDSPFIRVSRGVYGLRHPASAKPEPDHPTVGAEPGSMEDEDAGAGLINAFGMYWERDNVLWSTVPRLLGQQQPGSEAVDFCNQRGVYLLHDRRSVVYVGRTTEQALGIRLRQHTADRLNGRWDRFSWFGILSVGEGGALRPVASDAFSQDVLIATMEALLIEGLEPPQNRKRGDDFRAIEYLQVKDPAIHKRTIVALMDELKAKL
jgi:hypothetical protein